MPSAILAFNRGRLSQLALARTDFTRTQFSAEIQTNWMPRALGSMMLRPGLQYTGATRDNEPSVTIPFIFAIDDTARLETTDGALRVWVDDELVTREDVSTTIANGTFASNLSSWSDQDGGSAVSAWATGGYMSLIGTGNAAAKRRQQVTVTDTGVRHALDIVIARGPALLRVGSTAGGDEYIAETALETGAHSLAFTPSGNFYIDLFNFNEYAALVDSVAVASAGAMVLDAPWARADLKNLRWDQSGDVVFVACSGYRQRRIERRAVDSWSIVEYKSNDGPFMVQNVGPITITPTATSGDTVLTASSALFRAGHVGALFKLTQTGQRQDEEIDGEDQFCDPIRVVGVDGSRVFTASISGTWSGTVTLQYAFDAAGPWIDAPAGGGSGTMTFTTNTVISYDDTLDNQVLFYRLGVKAGDFVTGPVTVILAYSSGSQSGIARITGYTNPTTVNVQVLVEFGDITATSDWSESYWSDLRGYPSALAFFGGRLWWAGKDRVWGSISDAFDSFDDEFEGDAGPISRSIGSGPVDRIFWMLGANRLLLGAAGNVHAIRSSSLDEPITPTNFNMKGIETPGDGAANVIAVKSGTKVVYVQAGGQRAYEAAVGDNGYDYDATDLTVHVPEIGEPGIVRIVEQNQPERRRHCIRSDGTVAIQVYDKGEEVNAWIDFETDGLVVDAMVLPGTVEDQVYYTIRRTIEGAFVHYHEKWAAESDCVGGTLNLQADSFVTGTGDVTGLDHLEGEEVVIWASGADQGTATVENGAVDASYGAWVAGLAYEAPYKSVKLAYASQNGGTALCQEKKVAQIGIIARNLHPRGLMYGPDFETMDDMPGVEAGAVISQSTVREAYDEAMFTFPGEWDTDARICLKAQAPRPCTLLAVVFEFADKR